MEREVLIEVQELSKKVDRVLAELSDLKRQLGYIATQIDHIDYKVAH